MGVAFYLALRKYCRYGTIIMVSGCFVRDVRTAVFCVSHGPDGIVGKHVAYCNITCVRQSSVHKTLLPMKRLPIIPIVFSTLSCYSVCSRNVIGS